MTTMPENMRLSKIFQSSEPQAFWCWPNRTVSSQKCANCLNSCWPAASTWVAQLPDDPSSRRGKLTSEANHKTMPAQEIVFPVSEKRNPVEEIAFPDQETWNPDREITFAVQEKKIPHRKSLFPIGKREIPIRKSLFLIRKCEILHRKSLFQCRKSKIPWRKSLFLIGKREIPIGKSLFLIRKCEIPHRKSLFQCRKSKIPWRKSLFLIGKCEIPHRKSLFLRVGSSEHHHHRRLFMPRAKVSARWAVEKEINTVTTPARWLSVVRTRTWCPRLITLRHNEYRSSMLGRRRPLRECRNFKPGRSGRNVTVWPIMW